MDKATRKRPRHLFPKRKPLDSGEMFRLAMEETEIRDRLAEANHPRLSCLVCSLPAAGVATFSPAEAAMSDSDGPRELGCPLCQPCKDRSEIDSAFRAMIFARMLKAWKAGRGLDVLIVELKL